MMNRLIRRLCALVGCFLALLPLASAMAGEVEMNASIGYDGVVTYLRRLPIAVEVTNHGEDATGVLVVDIDRTETQYDRYTMPLTIAAGATINVSIPVSLTTKQEAFNVQWLEDGKVEAQAAVIPKKVMDPATFIVGVWSDQPQQLSYLSIGTSSDVLKRDEVWQTQQLTAATFPASLDAMRFFDMLVVDGMDASQLSAAQQEALDGWLRSGGIVVVGGGAQAAAAFPFFYQYSGITAGTLTDSVDVSQTLLDGFKLSEKPLEQTVSTVALRGAKGRAIGETRIVNLDRVDDGYLFTAAFSLSEKPLSTWMGKNVIWQRILLQNAQSRYTAIFLERMNNANSFYASNNISNLSSGIPVPNEGATALPVILLALFVALVGFGGYLLLKKLDKTDLLWVVIPALCLGFALAVWGTSVLINIREPMAVSATTVIVDEEGNRKAYTAVSAARAEAGRARISLEQGSINIDSAVNTYVYAQTDNNTEPVRELRYEIDLGSNEAVTFNNPNSWGVNDFWAENIPLSECGAKGEAGWEGAKLVFTLTNTGAEPLKDGVIILDYGYVATPALLPGETVAVEMAPRTEVDANGAPKLMNGRLFSDAERQNFSFYDYVNSYQEDLVHSKAVPLDDVSFRINQIQGYGNANGWYEGIKNPIYFTFSDSLSDVNVMIDGKPVTRAGQRDTLITILSFNPVSKDGTVRFLRGYINAFPAAMDDAGVPTVMESGLPVSGYSSYRLSEEPIFAFDMRQIPQSWTLENMDISPRYSYYSYIVELYRVKDGEWVEFKEHASDQSGKADTIKLPKPGLEAFIDANGILYARFLNRSKTDEYAEMTLPALTMDGRLK